MDQTCARTAASSCPPERVPSAKLDMPAFEKASDNAGSPFAPVNHAIWS